MIITSVKNKSLENRFRFKKQKQGKMIRKYHFQEEEILQNSEVNTNEFIITRLFMEKFSSLLLSGFNVVK